MIRIARKIVFLLLFWVSITSAGEINISLPKDWSSFQPILHSRVTQHSLKMKLQLAEVNSFVCFLKTLPTSTSELINLQKSLPKTTLELLMAVHKRDLVLIEAEKMAHYLDHIVQQFAFKNIKAFDENTSHIIGREWHEIDYSGENMTWQKQKRHYKPYGIKNFKSEKSLSTFFKVECRMPYFKRIYQPKNPNALAG